MTGQAIRFYFDYESPNAYLAWTQLPALAARHQATIGQGPAPRRLARRRAPGPAAVGPPTPFPRRPTGVAQRGVHSAVSLTVSSRVSLQLPAQPKPLPP